MTPSIFSIDVEDWYHILDVPSAPDISRWDDLPVRVEVTALAEGDQLLDERPYLLRLGLGGPDPPVLDQRRREVRVQRAPVRGVASQLATGALVAHGISPPGG